LGHLGGIFSVAENLKRNVKRPLLMAPDQFVERFFIAGPAPLHQATVVYPDTT
jgi:hypothetical protein